MKILSLLLRTWLPSAMCCAAILPPLFAQTPNTSFAAPRLKNGQPDLQGLWKLVASGPPPRAGSGIFAGMEYLPAALAAREELAKRPHEDFVVQWVTASVPGAALYPPYPSLIVQDGSFVVIMYEFAHDVRIIPVDGSPHPKNYAALNGDSRAHWEGDTLVVDVTNFSKGKRWLNMGADFLDENSHVVERYTLTAPDTIGYEVTVEDPTVLAKPWTARVNFIRQPKGDQILEGACREGERDLEHYVAGDGTKPK
jgi:hypothetical protein